MSVTIQDRALEFSVSVLQLFRSTVRNAQSNVLCHQVYRSSTSIGANIVEAQHAASRKEFIRYLHIALRSSRETEYWLKLCERVQLTEQKKITLVLQENHEISKILAAIILSTKTKQADNFIF